MSIADYTKSIKIYGYEYELNMRHPMRELGAMGDCDSQMLIIRVANDIAPQQQISTVLHEILEAIKSANEMELPHADLCTLETGLFQVLTQNGVNLKPLLDVKNGGES